MKFEDDAQWLRNRLAEDNWVPDEKMICRFIHKVAFLIKQEGYSEKDARNFALGEIGSVL